MILNKQILTKAIKDDYKINGDGSTRILDDIDDLHDKAIDVIGIGECDRMYYEMLSLLNTDGQEILDDINNFIDENFAEYYGDPAFSSASDFWNYKLG